MEKVVASVVASLLHLVAYGLYTFCACKGKTKPNATVWGIWAFLGVLNATSYATVTDLVSGMQFMAGSMACIAAFAVMLFAGQFKPLTKKDVGYLATGMVAGTVWYIFKSAALANFIILFAYGISSWPLIEGLWRDPTTEDPVPWWLWTAAFVITTIVVILKHGLSVGVISPSLFLLMHFSVAILTYRKPKSVESPGETR